MSNGPTFGDEGMSAADWIVKLRRRASLLRELAADLESTASWAEAVTARRQAARPGASTVRP